MSNEKPRHQEDSSDVAQLRQELVETKQLMARQQQQIEALLGQHNFEGDKQVVVNLPNLLDRSRELSDRYTALADARQAKAEQELREGKRKFRICIIDGHNKKQLENLTAQTGGDKPLDPWEWRFNPFNPWRIVGGSAAFEAEAKYQKFFGIRSIGDGAQLVSYECDEEGRPLEMSTVA